MYSGLPWDTAPAKPFTQDVPQACFSYHMGCRKSLYICQLAMPKNLGFVVFCADYLNVPVMGGVDPGRWIYCCHVERLVGAATVVIDVYSIIEYNRCHSAG